MLKTDYKDAMYDGARKYRITANTDGTSVIADETAYTQEGDPFGANDINETNAAVNRQEHVTLNGPEQQHRTVRQWRLTVSQPRTIQHW